MEADPSQADNLVVVLSLFNVVAFLIFLAYIHFGHSHDRFLFRKIRNLPLLLPILGCLNSLACFFVYVSLRESSPVWLFFSLASGPIATGLYFISAHYQEKWRLGRPGNRVAAQ